MNKELSAGQLNRRITIMAHSRVKTNTGGFHEDFSAYKSCWAEFIPITGSEKIQGDRPDVEFDSIFRVRNITGLSNDMRIAFKGDDYDIVFIREWNMNQGFELFGKVRLKKGAAS